MEAIIEFSGLNFSIILNDYRLNQNHERKILWNILFLYIPPVILVIGLLGNIFSFCIFFKLGDLNKNFDSFSFKSFYQNAKTCLSGSAEGFKRPEATKKGLTIYLYLCLMALFDIGVLIFGLFNEWIFHLTKFDAKNYSLIVCSSFTFLSFLFSHCSSFIIVLTNGIRFVAIYNPQAATNMTKFKNVKLITYAILVTFSILNIHFFWNMELEKLDYKEHLNHIMIKSIMVQPNKYTLSELEFFFKNPDKYMEAVDLTTIKDYVANSNYTVEQNYQCVPKHTFLTNIWPIADKLIYCVLPFLLVGVFNVLIVMNISKYQKLKSLMYISRLKNEMVLNDSKLRNDLLMNGSCQSSKFNKKNEYEVISLETYKNNSSDLFCFNKHKSNINDSVATLDMEVKRRITEFKKYHLIGKKFTVMLLSVSVIFLVLTFPAVILFALLNTIKEKIEASDLEKANEFYERLLTAQKITLLLMYLNHCTNFFVYFLTNSRFRLQFKKNILNYSFSCTKLLNRVRLKRYSSRSSLYD